MSELPQYPTDARLGPALLRTLGSFWYHYFGDRDRLETLLTGQGYRYGQGYMDFLEVVAALSRLTVPVFHTEDWYLLILKRSDRDGIFNIYEPGGLTYGGVPQTLYGQAQGQEFLFPLPNEDFFGKLTDAPFTIHNTVLYPSKTFTNGVDFDIDDARGLIRFKDDPFASDMLARRDVYNDAGELIDEEVGVWVYRGDWDKDDIYLRWGFAVGVQLESSEFYKDLVNALWDSHVLGPTVGGMQKAISAMLGVPLVTEANETVEHIYEEPARTLIMTDKHVYEFAAGVTPIVAVGDKVVAGESLIDGIRVVDLSGDDPDLSFISAMALDSKFLSGGYFSELVFENRDVSVDYLGLDEDNKAVVTFEIQGFPGDIDLFFAQAQENAKEQNKKTLAELLDTRDNPVSQPLPAYLPSQLNPLEFVLDEIMRNHLFAVRVKTSAINQDAPGLSMFRFLRNVVPPQTTYLVFVEIAGTPDNMDLANDGSDGDPGVEEDTSRFDGIDIGPEEAFPVDEAPADALAYEDTVTVYQTSEVCK